MAVFALAVWGLLEYSGRSDKASKGPLHSAHAGLEDNCQACHGDFGSGVEETRCKSCHEPGGTTYGVHTFERHVLYVDGGADRVQGQEQQAACLDCHTEHKGRQASLTRVTDDRCSSCHYDSFEQHADFFTEASPAGDDSSLVFPHDKHIQPVLDALETTQLEQACVACHNPTGTGASFAPISFDNHCSRCHLVNTEGASLPLAGYGSVGVESLSQIRSRNEPGTAWAFSASNAEFKITPTRIKKSRLRHKDPWVIENLRQLRRSLRGDLGPADAIPTTGLALGEDARDIYASILTELILQADALRGRPEPEVNTQLNSLDSLITAIQIQIVGLSFPIDDPSLTLPPLGSLSPESGALLGTAERLSRECRVCHLMNGASFERVQKDQGVLKRAVFDHSAHVLVASCIDCHRPDDPSSSMQNIPAKESCAGCHNPKQTDASCTSCHSYHPESHARLTRASVGGR